MITKRLLSRTLVLFSLSLFVLIIFSSLTLGYSPGVEGLPDLSAGQTISMPQICCTEYTEKDFIFDSSGYITKMNALPGYEVFPGNLFHKYACTKSEEFKFTVGKNVHSIRLQDLSQFVPQTVKHTIKNSAGVPYEQIVNYPDIRLLTKNNEIATIILGQPFSLTLLLDNNELDVETNYLFKQKTFSSLTTAETISFLTSKPRAPSHFIDGVLINFLSSKVETQDVAKKCTEGIQLSSQIKPTSLTLKKGQTLVLLLKKNIDETFTYNGKKYYLYWGDTKVDKEGFDFELGNIMSAEKVQFSSDVEKTETIVNLPGGGGAFGISWNNFKEYSSQEKVDNYYQSKTTIPNVYQALWVNIKEADVEIKQKCSPYGVIYGELLCYGDWVGCTKEKFGYTSDLKYLCNQKGNSLIWEECKPGVTSSADGMYSCVNNKWKKSASECTTDAQCDDQTSCTVEKCVNKKCVYSTKKDSCLIGVACYVSGESKPADSCQVCDPNKKQDGWTAATGCINPDVTADQKVNKADIDEIKKNPKYFWEKILKKDISNLNALVKKMQEKWS